MLESLHSMPALDGVSSFSRSTVREDVSSFSQSTIYQSGSAYRPLVSSLYACPETRIVLVCLGGHIILESFHNISLESVHNIPFRQRVSSFSQFTICLSSRLYHLWVSPLPVCPWARTILESLHCIPVPARLPSLSKSTLSLWEGVSSPSQFTLCLSGSPYHPWVNTIYASSETGMILDSVHYMLSGRA